MSRVLLNSSFNFKNQISKYVGKVRDVYELKDDILIMIYEKAITTAFVICSTC